MTNKTFTSIFIECKPSYNGGLQQTFIIEVFPVSAIDASSLSQHASSSSQQGQNEQVGGANVGSKSRATSSGLTSPITRLENRHFPQFSIEELTPGTAFGMVVYAQNSKVTRIK